MSARISAGHTPAGYLAGRDRIMVLCPADGIRSLIIPLVDPMPGHAAIAWIDFLPNHGSIVISGQRPRKRQVGFNWPTAECEMATAGRQDRRGLVGERGDRSAVQ